MTAKPGNPVEITPDTLTGFEDIFYAMRRRTPTSQEVFDAGVRSGLRRSKETIDSALLEERAKTAYWARRCHDVEMTAQRVAPIPARRDGEKFADWAARVYAAKEAEPVDDHSALRLRRIVNLLGLNDAVPKGDSELMGCLFSVLGMIARKIEQPAETSVAPNPALDAIQFALETDDGLQFLRRWNQGDFDVTRREWPEAPESIYIGADQFHGETPV